jgi:hypothetical protein
MIPCKYKLKSFETARCRKEGQVLFDQFKPALELKINLVLKRRGTIVPGRS